MTDLTFVLDDCILLSELSPSLQADLEACTIGGQDAAPAVDYVLENYIVEINPDDARLVLCQYGVWDEDELANDRQNQERVIWVAACQLFDEKYDGEDEPAFYFSK